MQKLGRRPAVTFVVLALLALGLPSGVTAQGGDAVPDVVARYAPLVYLHPDEDLLPYAADIYKLASELYLDASGYPTIQYLDAPDYNLEGRPIGQSPAYYEYEQKRYIIYWFFYASDRQWLAGDDLVTVKEHEGDWEHIVIRLDTTDEPVAIAYYQHECDPRIFAWEELDGHEPFGSWTGFWGETHPIVYSALGSHASYWGPRRRAEPIGTSCPSVISDLRGDAAQKGAAWKTWEGAGLVDARVQGWYEYEGLWGKRSADPTSLDPDDSLVERFPWSSGGLGPSASRLPRPDADIPPASPVIPKGWEVEVTSAPDPPREEVPAPAQVRLRAGEVGSCPAGSAPACTEWRLTWEPVKGARAYRIHAVYHWFAGGACDVQTGQTDRQFRWRVGPKTTSFSGSFAPDYVELPRQRTAIGATYYVAAVDAKGRESLLSSSGRHDFLDLPPCGQEYVPKPGFIEFTYEGKRFRYENVECSGNDQSFTVQAGSSWGRTWAYLDVWPNGRVWLFEWQRDGMSYVGWEPTQRGWSEVERDGSVATFDVEYPYSETSASGRYRCPG